jgi:hypothetical protein
MFMFYLICGLFAFGGFLNLYLMIFHTDKWIKIEQHGKHQRDAWNQAFTPKPKRDSGALKLGLSIARKLLK